MGSQSFPMYSTATKSVHFGQVSMYDGFPDYVEVHRKIYENYPPDGEWGYETQRARDLQWQQDMVPLVNAMDFVTLSHYGPWETLDPASLIPPRHSKAVWQQILGPAIRDAYAEVQRVHGFTPVSFFFTTNQPAVWFGGGTGGGDGVLEFPADILQWNLDRVVEHVPAGLREVNMWQGPAPYRGYWNAAEVATMIDYGTP